MVTFIIEKFRRPNKQLNSYVNHVVSKLTIYNRLSLEFKIVGISIWELIVYYILYNILFNKLICCYDIGYHWY